MSVVPSDADSVLGSAGGRSVDTSSSSVQERFQSGRCRQGRHEEIDPIAEADVYMATAAMPRRGDPERRARQGFHSPGDPRQAP